MTLMKLLEVWIEKKQVTVLPADTGELFEAFLSQFSWNGSVLDWESIEGSCCFEIGQIDNRELLSWIDQHTAIGQSAVWGIYAGMYDPCVLALKQLVVDNIDELFATTIGGAFLFATENGKPRFSHFLEYRNGLWVFAVGLAITRSGTPPVSTELSPSSHKLAAG